MTQRRIAASGDRTTTGGQVIVGASNVNVPTGQTARLGDEVWCPACKQTGHIAQGYTGFMIDNRPVALDDYPVRCGCPDGSHRIIATTNFIFVDDDYGDVSYLPASSLRATLNSGGTSDTTSFSSLNSSGHLMATSLNSGNNDEQKNAVKVFAKSCTVDKECSDAATGKEPVTNFGTMLIYGIASAFSSTSEAHHSSFLPYNAPNKTPSYPINGGVAGAVPSPVIVPTPAGPMISLAPVPVATYPSSNIKIPSLFNNPEATLLVSAAAIKSSKTGQTFTSTLVGMLIAEFFSDSVQYDDTELRDLAKIQGNAKTRVRFFFERSTDSSQQLVYGLHAVEGTRYEEVRVREMKWNNAENRYEFTELGETKPTIIWTPANPAGSDIPTNTGYPAPNNGEFNQPVIHIHPIHEFNKSSGGQGLPLLDPRNFNDYILVFPADAGIPPIYVYFSKVFRGDDTYAGGPVGQPKEGEITAEDIIKHVGEEGDGRLTSFSEKLKSSSGNRGADYFTKKGKIVKVELEDLESLSAQGEISIIKKDQAREIIRNHPKKKIKDSANAIYQTMDKNNEILVHGQIPGRYVKPTK